MPNEKINFLLESYKDTENLIRLCDAKAAGIITILAFMFLPLVTPLKGTVIRVFEKGEGVSELIMGAVLIILILGFLGSALLTFSYMFKTVKPRKKVLEHSFETKNVFWCLDICQIVEKHGADHFRDLVNQIDSFDNELIKAVIIISQIGKEKLQAIDKASQYLKYTAIFWLSLIAITIFI
ncbi:MAG TPA: hypothetical protein VNN20_00210 [Thermodesulfobacteriota bacterium]|nr:hypothetical protein [Thermodesulfobacteriota bacterium]